MTNSEDLTTIKQEMQERAESISFEKVPVIKNEDGARDVSENLRKVKLFIKEANERRLELTRPLDESKRGIMDLFRSFTTKAESAKEKLETGLFQWQEKIEKEEQKKRLEIAKKEKEERERIENDDRLKEETKEDRISEVENNAGIEHAQIETSVKSRSGISIKTTTAVEISDSLVVLKSIIDQFEKGNITSDELYSSFSLKDREIKKMLERGVKIEGAKIVKQKHASL